MTIGTKQSNTGYPKYASIAELQTIDLKSGDTAEVVSASSGWTGAGNKPKGRAVYNVVTLAEYTIITSLLAADGVNDWLLTNGNIAMLDTAAVIYPFITGEPTVTDYSKRVGDVRRYGATGNGTTDDIVALNAASTFANTSSTYKTVFIPNGTYMISTPFNIYHEVKYVGEGQGTIIKPLAAFVGAAALLGIGSVNALWMGYFSISEMKIDNSVGPTLTHGISLLGAVWEWTITNVVVTGFSYTGLILDRCYRGTINNIGIYSCGTSGTFAALDLRSTIVGDKCNIISFIGGQIQDTPTGIRAIEMDTAGFISFYNFTFQSNGYGVRLKATNNVTFIGSYFEDLDREITTEMKGSVRNTNLRVMNCGFARATYTLPIILNGDEDTVFDQILSSGTNIQEITTNTNSLRSRIINSPKLFYVTDGISKNEVVVVDDDFYGAQLNPNDWALSAVGSGSGALLNTNDGVYRLSTGGTNGSNSILTQGANPLIYISSNPVVEMRGKLSNVTNGTTRFISLENGAAWIRVYAANGAGATNVILEVYNGTAASTAIASLVIDTSWHTYKLFIDSGKVELYLDGKKEGTLTANIPTVPLQLKSLLFNSAAQDNQLEIDFLRMTTDKV